MLRLVWLIGETLLAQLLRETARVGFACHYEQAPLDRWQRIELEPADLPHLVWSPSIVTATGAITPSEPTEPSRRGVPSQRAEQ